MISEIKDANLAVNEVIALTPPKDVSSVRIGTTEWSNGNWVISSGDTEWGVAGSIDAAVELVRKHGAESGVSIRVDSEQL